MKLPVVIVNFKTYLLSTGEKAVELAKICEKVATESGKEVVVAVQAADIYRVSQAVKIPVFAEHVDDAEQGQSTGFTTMESVKEAGAVGTLVNHSEHSINKENIEKTVNKAKEMGMVSVVCVKNPDEGAELDPFKPDFIAVEPPELIGGDISVSTAQPEVIEDTVSKIEGERVIVGAGVKTKKDVEIAVKLGSVGVLVASGIVKADDPEKELKGLVDGL